MYLQRGERRSSVTESVLAAALSPAERLGSEPDLALLRRGEDSQGISPPWLVPVGPDGRPGRGAAASKARRSPGAGTEPEKERGKEQETAEEPSLEPSLLERGAPWLSGVARSDGTPLLRGIGLEWDGLRVGHDPALEPERPAVDARSPRGQSFSRTRLREVLRRMPGDRTPGEVIDNLLQEVSRHSGGGPLGDDVTALMIARDHTGGAQG